jgi:hypothetical protein
MIYFLSSLKNTKYVPNKFLFLLKKTNGLSIVYYSKNKQNNLLFAAALNLLIFVYKL